VILWLHVQIPANILALIAALGVTNARRCQAAKLVVRTRTKRDIITMSCDPHL
jgi:hypothetical protein